MIVLGSLAVFDKLAELDPETGAVRYFSGKAEPELAKNVSRGGYDELDGHRAFLYAHDGSIVFRLDDTIVPITDNTRTTFVRNGSKHILMILESTNLLLKFEYERPKLPTVTDPFTYEEAEDFDFGLLVHNILSSKNRRKVILGYQDV